LFITDKSPATLRRRAYMKREDFIHQLSEQEKDRVLRQVEELREHALGRRFICNKQKKQVKTYVLKNLG
jgi:hypothetical protein